VVGSKRLGHVFSLPAADTLPRVVLAVDRVVRFSVAAA